MTKTLAQVAEALEQRAPRATAEDWDNVGLLVGDPNWKTHGAVLSIDLSMEAIRLARQKGFRLIINHHPCIFPKSRGLSRVVAEAGSAGLVFEAARHGIGVIACHTCFDRSALEVPLQVAKALGFEAQGRLHADESPLLKLTVFVPESHAESVANALFAAGAGHVGRYDSCGFSVMGQGQFRGSDATRPFVGQSGRLERVREVRFETILPRGMEAPVIRALKNAHPYEEVAYDLYPLEQPALPVGLVSGLGYGVWGDLPKPKSFSEVAKNVRRVFNVKSFWITDPAPKTVRRIGFVAGKGSDFLGAAKSVGCDLFVTGEAGYHAVLDGKRRGIAVLELGHRESELFFTKTVKGWVSALGLRASELLVVNQRIITC